MAAFDDCLTKGRLKKIDPDVELIARELGTAKEELERARLSCASGNWNDTAMQSYFVLTRCARAAVNARGYKDTNLYGLQIALEHLFIEPGELDKAITKQIRDAKDVKDAVYSGRRSSPYESKQMLMWAQKFAKFVFGRLALPGFDGEQVPTNIPEPVAPAPRDVAVIDDGQQAMGVGEPPRRRRMAPALGHRPAPGPAPPLRSQPAARLQSGPGSKPAPGLDALIESRPHGRRPARARVATPRPASPAVAAAARRGRGQGGSRSRRGLPRSSQRSLGIDLRVSTPRAHDRPAPPPARAPACPAASRPA